LLKGINRQREKEKNPKIRGVLEENYVPKTRTVEKEETYLGI
jgi:hypothetical protein